MGVTKDHKGTWTSTTADTYDSGTASSRIYEFPRTYSKYMNEKYDYTKFERGIKRIEKKLQALAEIALVCEYGE